MARDSSMQRDILESSKSIHRKHFWEIVELNSREINACLLIYFLAINHFEFFDLCLLFEKKYWDSGSVPTQLIISIMENI